MLAVPCTRKIVAGTLFTVRLSTVQHCRCGCGPDWERWVKEQGVAPAALATPLPSKSLLAPAASFSPFPSSRCPPQEQASHHAPSVSPSSSLSPRFVFSLEPRKPVCQLSWIILFLKSRLSHLFLPSPPFSFYTRSFPTYPLLPPLSLCSTFSLAGTAYLARRRLAVR